MNRVLEFTTPLLPANKPRYLMGVGSPDSLIDGAIVGLICLIVCYRRELQEWYVDDQSMED